MESAAGGRQLGRDQILQRRAGIPAVGERGAAAREQQTAAAAIHEIANQLLLRGREVIGLHAADDEALESKKLVGFGGEAIFELVLVLGALHVELILRGAQ